MADQPASVRPEERLSRFIIERNKMRKDRVHHTAFIPPLNKKLSVFRTGHSKEGDIWNMGLTIVAEPRGKTLYARADFTAADAFSQKLQVEPDPRPHLDHANLEGWPDDEAQIEQIALELAQVAKLVLVQ